ncbi:checkpoint protein Hus1/Mec3 [Gorgonomyces haynaldii]|nr:checkpoint protein Hus1/Mec3 [Gorgonomyces haynaldii]
MRLNCKIESGELLYNTLQCLETMGKQWFLVFKPSSLEIILEAGHLRTFVNISTTLFQSYLVEAKHQNTIYMEIMGEYLLRALKSGQKSPVSISLRKKEYAVLSVITKQGKRMILTHDVPVDILDPLSASNELREPRFDHVPIQTMLPRMSKLGQFVHRTRHLTHLITISSNGRRCTLSVNTDKAKIETVFCGLETIDNPDLPTQLPSTSQTTVDVRDLVRFMHLAPLDPLEIVLSLVPHLW